MLYTSRTFPLYKLTCPGKLKSVLINALLMSIYIYELLMIIHLLLAAGFLLLETDSLLFNYLFYSCIHAL